jgi:putative membrane protein
MQHCVETISPLIRATLTLMSLILLIIAIVFSALAALLHVVIFLMESVLWMRPATWKRFGLTSQDEAATIRPMALNQGFYNLFLAVGIFVAFFLLPHPTLHAAGVILILFCCASMLAAALVLIISNPKLARAAITQGVFPLLAVISLAILGVTIVTGTA